MKEDKIRVSLALAGLCSIFASLVATFQSIAVLLLYIVMFAALCYAVGQWLSICREKNVKSTLTVPLSAK